MIGTVSSDRVSPSDLVALRVLLIEADPTRAGSEAPGVRLRVERNAVGSLIGSTGYELSEDGEHALIRSVAVAPGSRGSGAGPRLAHHALMEATADGATRAWSFSRRSGPFWANLGFSVADRHDLASALPVTHQVQLFIKTGRPDREIAWSRPLISTAHYRPVSVALAPSVNG